ncbi:MAG: tetratricopeptide repeat protein, partial [Anaerolineae bacterium]|nr:tetratricopeptide repeat protein [Anaerolineae bacterium]
TRGPLTPTPPLHPEAERARLLEQVSSLILNMAGEQPTLLLLDDLHFADPGSLDLLETLVRRAKGTSLLIAAAYRDVALSYDNPVNHLISALTPAKLAYTIPLRRLPKKGVAQLLLALLGDSVSAGFVHSIYEATEGNPLFVEEVIKGLAVDGQIRLRNGRWEQRDTDRLNVPGSIKSVLGGRLKRIKKSTFELLQLAAVIGRTFSLDLLSSATEQEDESIQFSIEEALRYQLVEVAQVFDEPDQKAVNVRYQFQHALIRETLYEELRPLRRRQLHRKVAAAMEQLAATKKTNMSPAVLAHHFIAAAQEERAVPYLRHAGSAAGEVYANVEAVDYLSQAREILEDVAHDLQGEALVFNLTKQFDLLSEERDILNVMGDSSRELEGLERLLELATTLKDDERWVKVTAQLAAYYWRVGKLSQAEETAQRALEMAKKNDDTEGKLFSLEQIARVLWTRRDAASMDFATEALELARQLTDRQREGRLMELIASIYTDTLNDIERAALYFAQALEICREVGNRYEEAWTLWGMGRLALLVDDFTGALERFNTSRKISEEIGSTLQTGWDIYLAGDAWYGLGDYERAWEQYEQAQTIFETAHHQRGMISSLISLGIVCSIRGELIDAEYYLEEARQQAEDRDDVMLMLRSYAALSAHYRQTGVEDQIVSAVRLSNRMIKLAVDGGHYEHELLGYHLRAAGFYDLHDMGRALESSELAIDALEQIRHLHSPQISVAEIYYQHSLILAALGQAETAKIYLDKAYDETMRKANFIVDDQQYNDFLSRVPLNQQIIAAVQ